MEKRSRVRNFGFCGGERVRYRRKRAGAVPLHQYFCWIGSFFQLFGGGGDSIGA